MVGDFGWEHEGTKSGVGTVKRTYLLGMPKLISYSALPMQKKPKI